MKYLFLILMLVGLVSCQACNKNDIVAPPLMPIPTLEKPIEVLPDSTKQNVVLGSMHVTIPIEWVQRSLDDNSIEYVNLKKKNLILLAGEPCKNTYNQCMLYTLKGISHASIELSSAEDIVLNGNKLILVESHNEEVKIWSWISINNNMIYMLSCGGLETDLDNKEICAKIASTLTLN